MTSVHENRYLRIEKLLSTTCVVSIANLPPLDVPSNISSFQFSGNLFTFYIFIPVCEPTNHDKDSLQFDKNKNHEVCNKYKYICN